MSDHLLQKMKWSVEVFNKKLTVVWALLATWFCNPLLASDGHINWWGLGSKYEHTPAMGWYIVTFLIFTGGLLYSVRKPLAIYLETRAKDIKNAILEAKQAKDEANARIKTYEDRLKSLDKEMAFLRAKFLETGENEKKRLAGEAEIIKKQIAAETVSVIGAETARAKTALKAQAARLSIMLAKEELKKGKVKIDNQTLNHEFLSDVSCSERV